jgi:NAD(P)-dependent dehydrogenase (short-subunit alcohol dehydrogenase family)
VSSVHEVIPWAGHVNYAASKGGVMLMMKSVHGITLFIDGGMTLYPGFETGG